MNVVLPFGMDSIGPNAINSPTLPLSTDAGSSMTSSSSRQFPAGLRVLVVDDDPLCLKIVEKMLRNCQYDVTTCSRAAEALSLLRERKGSFDLVLSDVYMPDMDGFTLLELIGLEMDLPVIMMSADDSKEVVLKGVTHGAVDYVTKPVRMEVMRNVWQHVARKMMCNDSGLEQTGSLEESNERQKKVSDDGDNASSSMNVKKRKDDKEEDEIEEREDSSSAKKPRVVWSVDLHQQFVTAVNRLGIERAVPKKILEIMKVPGLTRENVASHLQKYRLYLKKLHARSNQGSQDAQFQGISDPAYDPIGAINEFGIPHKNHMNVNVGTIQCPSSGIAMPVVDRVGYIGSNQQISNASRMISGQQWSSPGQMNLIAGAAFNMESRQSQQVLQAYGSLSQQACCSSSTNLLTPSSSVCTNTSFIAGSLSAQPRNSMIMQAPQQGQHFPVSRQQNHLSIHTPRQAQDSNQLLNRVTSELDGRVLSNIGQQVLSNDIYVYGQAPFTGTMMTTSYGSAPQALNSDLENNYSNVSIGNFFPFGLGTANFSSTGLFQDCVTSSGLLDAIKPELRGVNDGNQAEYWNHHSMLFSNELPQRRIPRQNNINFSSSISAIKDGNTQTSSKEVYKITSQGAKVECLARNRALPFDNAVELSNDGILDSSYEDRLFADTLIQNGLADQDLAGQSKSDFNIEYSMGGFQQ